MGLSRVSAIRHLGRLKLFLTAGAFERHVLHNHAKFVEIGHTVAEISQVAFVFLVKCKNSLDHHTWYGITFSQLEITA